MHHDARVARLMQRLATRRPADDISDAKIAAEVRMVREERAAGYDTAPRR